MSGALRADDPGVAERLAVRALATGGEHRAIREAGHGRADVGAILAGQPGDLADLRHLAGRRVKDTRTHATAPAVIDARRDDPAVGEDHGLQGRPPVVDDLPRLPYLRMVFEEAMRLYPPVCFMARQAAREEVIGGTTVPARAIVLVSAWTTHRHKDFWEDAGRFDPERFRPDRSRGRHRFAYFPFAGGRHQCIGQAFAMLEGQLILAAVLQRCRLRAVPGHVVEPLPSLTLRLKNGLRVTAEGRSPGTARRRDD